MSSVPAVGNNDSTFSGNTESGKFVYSDYGDSAKNIGATEYPMMVYNGLLVPKRNRQAPSMDQDLYPSPPLRRYQNLGVTDVQINNGLRWRVGSGLRFGYRGAGYMYGVVPQIPGQTRDNAAGFHTRGPSPLNVAAMYEAGPGSQPANPGGPGRIAAPMFYNPMTG